MADEEVALQPQQVARAAVVTVPEDVRQRLNGETGSLMQHLKMVKERGAGKPTSDDQPWKMDCCLLGTDLFAIAVTLLWAIKLLLFGPLVFLACVPTCVFLRLSMVCVPVPTDALRSILSFGSLLFLSQLLFVPVMLLTALSLLFDYALYSLFGLLWCTLTFRWLRWRRSMEALAPYRGGPSVWLHSMDFFTSLAGQLPRRGLFLILLELTSTCLVLPWLKYWFLANPFLYDLGERFVNQVGAPLQFDAMKEVSVAVELISQCKLSKENWKNMSKQHFIPHYPFPPSTRRWHLGTQSYSKGLFHMLTVVHTTHSQSNHGGSYEQMVVSNECSHPGYRVMLWYNNPFHPYTGYVEANIQKSWLDGEYHMEHPMWIVSCHSPLMCSHQFGLQPIDDFFTYDMVPNLQAAVEGEIESLHGDVPNIHQLEGNLPGAVPS